MSASALIAGVLAAAQPAAVADPGALAPNPPVSAPDPAAPAVDAPAAPTTAPAPAPAPPPQPAPPATPAKGEIVVIAGKGTPGDPAEKVNEASFAVVQKVDDAVVGPVARTYETKVPKPVRKGLRNVLNNLSEPINALNFLLQLKPGKAVKSLGRFAINTTVGIGGITDVAAKKPFNLPYNRNGFANTFGYYGIGPGPYLYLPLIGPTTVRDLTGRILDLSLIPAVGGKPFNTPAYALGTGVVRSLDDRVEIDAFLKNLRTECEDPYAAEREYYLLVRHAEIEALHGRKVDLSDKLPTCLVDGPMSRVGQASPPAESVPQPSTPAPAPAPQAEPQPPAPPAPESPAAPVAVPPPADQAATAPTM